MNLQLKTSLSFLLPALLAGSAAAQVVSIFPGAWAPSIAILPGRTPVMRIELPSPRLDPGLTITLAPVVAGVFPALPLPRIPSRPIVPIIRPVASRENVAHPLAAILPGLGVQLGAAEKKEPADAAENRRREILDHLFDRRPAPSQEPEPVRPSRQIGLPERDLEKEIGAFSSY
jgi:hypothetical protein